MLGSIEEAAVALELFKQEDYYKLRNSYYDNEDYWEISYFGDLNKSIGNDWQLIGLGDTRAIFLSPRKVVWKLNYTSNFNDHNQQEYDNKLAWQKLIEGIDCRFAYCEMYKIDGISVLAMEYVPFPCEEYEIEELTDTLYDRGMQDMHHGNIRTNELGELVLVDFSR